MATIYEINKGINRSLVFKGFKAQYIVYLAVGLVGLLLLLAIMFVIGINKYVCMGIVLAGGGAYVFKIQQLSTRYGENGLRNKMAARSLPSSVYARSRKLFIHLKPKTDEKK
jgi:hypothetical protein